MVTRRVQTVALLVIVLVLAVVVWYEWRPTPAGTQPPPSNVVAQRLSGATGQRAAGAVVDVNLEGLAGPRPAPDENDRNPFLFKPKPPPPPPQVALPPREDRDRPLQPPVPVEPSVPAITVKFIGIVDAPTQTGRIAILVDKGSVFFGKEGESGVDGRFKIWKIGVESIEISYVDGRGRTTIRLSGS